MRYPGRNEYKFLLYLAPLAAVVGAQEPEAAVGADQRQREHRAHAVLRRNLLRHGGVGLDVLDEDEVTRLERAA